MIYTISPSTASVVREDDLLRLPASVQRYLAYTGVIGQSWIKTVHIQYVGKFRTGADKAWMPITANQVYTTNPPSFLWKAQFKMAGLPLLFGNDTYKSGHSHMRGKLLGLFTVVEGQGDEVDQGTMLRYLQEMTWFPIAYLGDNIIWQAVDEHAADVTLRDHGKTVTGRMFFDDKGRLLSFVAQRYGEFDGTYSLNTWATPTTEYGEMAGLKLPMRGQGVWQLERGDFAYIDVQVKSIEYNVPIAPF